MPRKYSRSDYVEAVQAAADDLDQGFSKSEYNGLGLSPHSETIARHLGDGSWNAAKEEAGLSTPTEYTQEDCIAALQRAADILGQSPSAPKYLGLGLRPGVDTIKRLCGGWNNAKELAGLKTWKTKPRRLSVNDDFFEVIDTEEKAYWLGFLFADGSIRSSRNEVAIQLQRGDKRHLEKFRDALDSEYGIWDIDHDGILKTGTAITSDKMVSDLISHGCVPNKTHKDTYPDIDGALELAMIRGWFDGDGCFGVGIPSEGRSDMGYWHMTGASVSRLKKIRQCLVGHADVSEISIHQYDNATPWMRYQARGDVKSVYRALYPDGMETTPALSRKRDKFGEWIATTE